eukprot:gene27310-63422_t
MLLRDVDIAHVATSCPPICAAVCATATPGRFASARRHPHTWASWCKAELRGAAAARRGPRRSTRRR